MFMIFAGKKFMDFLKCQALVYLCELSLFRNRYSKKQVAFAIFSFAGLKKTLKNFGFFRVGQVLELFYQLFPHRD